ncbi:hypothetical protein TL16_g00932 [Triparma laevis f. inornata]|uniref:Uncharacterized protein n=1 Tax=Triparma laevis f. inornata TaxID=1714386 RepID=A0A9W7DUD1_9STRA|nr:hypothetical protein TL16_g00932 [Triparma laevis f. inornata]
MATYNTQNAARIKQALRSLALSLSPKQATDIIPTGDTTQRLYDDLIYNRKYGSRSLTRLPQDVLNRVQSLQQKDAETFYPSRDWDMIIQKMDGLESVVDVLLSLQRNGLDTYNANPHGTQELDPEMPGVINDDEIVRSLVLLLLQVSTSYFCPSPPPSKHAWTQTNWKSVSGLELVTGEFLIFAGNLSKVETHLSPKDSNQSLNWFVNTCKTFVDDFDSAVAVLLESADRRNLSFVQLYSAIYPFTHKVTELLNVIDESSDLNVYVATTPAGRAKSALDAALRNEVWDVWRQYSKDLKLWLETGKLPQDSSNNLFVVELDDWDYDVDVNAVPEIFEGVEWEVVKCGVQAGIYNGIMEESGGSLPPLPEIKFEEVRYPFVVNLKLLHPHSDNTLPPLPPSPPHPRT